MTDYSGQVLADKYRVDSLMRKTSLGDFYHGTHLSMEKAVTIKILPPALAVDETILGRFRTEAKTLARLSHPNILNITDEGTDKTRAEFIVFESAAGETLKDAVRRDRQFSLERANRVTRQIAAALSVAHAAGITHGNLTSENVILTKTADDADFVKVLNFGIDSLDPLDGGAASDEDMSSLRAAIEYLSPEQCSQTAEPDARSDIYSLGVILYEMLAGEVPFTADKPSDVMLKHAQEPPLSLVAFRNDLLNDVNQIILTALAKNPDGRYQTPNELAADLNRVTLASASSSAAGAYPHLSQSAPAAATAANGAQNNIWKTAFIVFAGIAVLGGFFIYMTQVKQTNPPTQLQTDANGQPVQPVNPPVGTSEQSLANMGGYAPDLYTNSNSLPSGVQQPQVLPGGDGYDPWARGGVPPPGAPQGNYGMPMYVPPTGQIYDGNVNPTSPFMQDGNTYILVPKNTNANVNAQTKRTPASNANAQTAPPANSTAKPSPAPPAANTAAPPDTKATPRSTPKPAASPKNNPAQKNTQSGKELDT